MIDFQHLTWDSDQFEIKVGKVLCEPDYSSALLRETLEKARQAKYNLVYCMGDASFGIDEELLHKFGGTFVDEKVTYSLKLTSSEDTADEVLLESYGEKELEPILYNLSYQCGEYSRFNVDPNFKKESFEQLYDKWIEGSVAGRLANKVFVVRNKEGAISGLITLALDDAVGSIGLIGVDKSARGQGLSLQLMNSAFSYFRQHGMSTIEVVTQSNNKPACSLYKKYGFEIKERQNIYHFWL